jgi:hypothetical protein
LIDSTGPDSRGSGPVYLGVDMEEQLQNYISWPQFMGVMFFYTFVIVGLIVMYLNLKKEEE